MPDVKIRIIALIAIAALLAAVFALPERFYEPPYYAPTLAYVPAAELDITNGIGFSHTDYFYTEGFELALYARDETVTEIYYSLGGYLPDTERGILYKGTPLKLNGGSGENIKSHTVRACGKRADGSFTDVYTRSYFVGEKVRERFDTLVFALTTDPYNLYDDEYGIFVEGKLRKDYIKETGDRMPDPPAPANYNMRGAESERPVYVELIDENGGFILAQNAGMRTHGGWSRANAQKSIKLFAREKYEPVRELNTFNYDFFPDDASIDGLSVVKYKSIILRNNANDNQFGFIRDEVIQARAETTGLCDVQRARPAAVFLNGEYYGFVWLKQVYDDNYLDRKNGVKDGDWVILSGGENDKDEEDDNAFAIADYNEVYAYSEKDLTDDAVFNGLLREIDMDNFLTYYAVQIYVANGDWPRGNYKVYKYFGDTAEQPANSAADGKWRWLLFDTDFGMGLYDKQPTEKTLSYLLGLQTRHDNQHSPLLAAVLKGEDMEEKFVRIRCDWMNEHFEPVNVANTTRELEASRLNELERNYKDGGAQLKNAWSNLGHVSGELSKIQNFAAQRPTHMKKQIIDCLEIEDDGFNIMLKTNENADITVNSWLWEQGARAFTGFYYNINTVELSARPVIGYAFSHWLVNGEVVKTPVLKLNAGDAKNRRIEAELVVVRDVHARPIIIAADYNDGADWLEIYNPFDGEIDLKRYYISDDADTPYKQTLAEYVLKPKETLRLYARNYGKIEALGNFMLAFNLKEGETVYITDSAGKIADSLYLADITDERVLKRNMRTGGYEDKIREDSLE